jgi:hypothetical protein
LTGRVVLEIARSFKHDGTLDLHIIGKEKTKKIKRQICRVDLTLYKGFYAFPFRVDLPASLPSSTGYKKFFRIEYKMIAGITRRSLQEQCKIVITSAPLPDEHVQRMIQPASHELKAAGMFSKGTVSIGASVTDSQVGRGQDLDLHLACRNDSTAAIRRVDIKLFEEMEWSTGKATVTHLHLPDVDLPGLEKFRRSRIDVRNIQADRTSEAVHYQEIFLDLVSGRSHLALKVPASAHDSYKGQIIQISHYVEIKLKTGSMVTDPVVRIPIRVGTPVGRTSPQQDFPNVLPNPEIPINSFSGTPDPEISIPVQYDGIPIVSAIALPADTFHAPMAIADPTVIVLGGNAIVQDSFNSLEDLSDLEPLPAPQRPTDRVSDLEPLPAPQRPTDRVSLDRLLFEMAQSIDDYGILECHLEDSEWRQLFARLTPDEFGNVILRVSDEFDVPRVAALLAPYLNGGNNFTCLYAAAAVQSSCEWNRSCVVQRLLPMCVDVTTEYERIRDELNAWDRTVTENDFQAAIDRSKQ